MNGDNFHSELMVLLKHAYDDIEHAKQMGWRDFYNVLIAIGAVTGLYSAVYEKYCHQWPHYIFFFAPLALLILGFLLIEASQDTLKQRRKLVEKVYLPHLNREIQNILNGSLGKPENRDLYPWLYRLAIVIMTIFAIVVMVGLKFSEA